MTGTHTQSPIFSRITLALMEDTGWYKANYSMASPLTWGRNLGCNFVKKSCKDWITSNQARYVKIIDVKIFDLGLLIKRQPKIFSFLYIYWTLNPI